MGAVNQDVYSRWVDQICAFDDLNVPVAGGNPLSNDFADEFAHSVRDGGRFRVPRLSGGVDRRDGDDGSIGMSGANSLYERLIDVPEGLDCYIVLRKV